MPNYASDCYSEFDDGMDEVNEWEQKSCLISYDSSYVGGLDYCNSNDVGYESSSYEAHDAISLTGLVCYVNFDDFSSDFFYGEKSLRGSDLPWSSDVKRSATPSNVYLASESPWGSMRESPQTSICQGSTRGVLSDDRAQPDNRGRSSGRIGTEDLLRSTSGYESPDLGTFRAQLHSP